MGNVISSVLSSGAQAAKDMLHEKAKYILELDDNLENLQLFKARLEAMKVDLQKQIEMEERKGLRPLEVFQEWLLEVEAIQPKVIKLLDDKTAEIERLSMCRYCSSNLFLTYRYGRDVLETLEKVKGTLSSKPSGVVARRVPPPVIDMITTQTTVGSEKMLEAIWRRLMEKEVGILGLYGMGGIGKTTLLKQINKKLLGKKDEFGVVIFVVVSQNLQVGKIQNEIGERLGLCDEEWAKKSQNEKTSRINDVLTRTRFVMLLDNIWSKVELEEIGIPLPSPENGSKVVFTTRSKKVCGRMGPNDMEVKHLDPDNAWELFRQKLREDTLASDPKIHELAKEICVKCQGLPLALKVIGETMAWKTTVQDWQCALDDLHSNAAADYPEVKDEIFKILKLSYDDLEDDKVQQCFQYCALFPEDYIIDKNTLVEYWMSEGIINEDGDREKTINKGYSIITILVSACLLMTDDAFEIVTMHDVLRQMALWVASSFGKEKESFIVKTGAGLDTMPKVRDWNAVRRMSLQNNEIQDISISPECANLTTLLLSGNKLLNIAGEFFLSMTKLVILDLSSNKNLTKLPEEVSKLASLQYLDLSRTSLENLPVGLGKLIKLRYLDLSGVRTLRSISVISSLVNIEILMLHYSTFASVELIEDIKLLKNLKSLGISINDMVVLRHLFSIPRLASCIKYIFLEGIVAEYVPFQTDIASLYSIVIHACFISDVMEPKRYGCISAICFQNLRIVEFVAVHGLTDLSWLIFAPNLTLVYVSGPSPELQEIVSREKVCHRRNEGSSIVPFRKLDTIYLGSLVELKSIYTQWLELPSLKRMMITNCPKLKKLPFNKERVMGNDFDIELRMDDFRGLEWEDEATNDQEIIPYQVALN